MCIIGFNLLNLSLNSEECESLEQYSLKTMRQKRTVEKNPKVIIYAERSFAVLPLHQFLALLLEVKDQAKDKLIKLFKSLDLHFAPG